MNQDIVVRVTEPGADAERLGTLVSALAEELEGNGDTRARPLRTGPAPEGARAADAESIGALLVSLSASMTALEAIIIRARAWLRRGPTDRAVEITLGDHTLKLSSVSEDEQRQLVAAFLDQTRQG